MLWRPSFLLSILFLKYSFEVRFYINTHRVPSGCRRFLHFSFLLRKATAVAETSNTIFQPVSTFYIIFLTCLATHQTFLLQTCDRHLGYFSQAAVNACQLLILVVHFIRSDITSLILFSETSCVHCTKIFKSSPNSKLCSRKDF